MKFFFQLKWKRGKRMIDSIVWVMAWIVFIIMLAIVLVIAAAVIHAIYIKRTKPNAYKIRIPSNYRPDSLDKIIVE